MMDWVLLGAGFTGALTLVFLWRKMVALFATPRTADVHFSPGGDCTGAVVDELRAARREVLVLAYSFTSRPIAEALVEVARRGVDVHVILDRSNEKEPYTLLPFLLEQGLRPHIDAHHAIAHNKVILIDGSIVITGSFNFTHQAQVENAENLLVLKGHPELARRYRADFEAHRGHSQPAAAGAHATGGNGHHRRAA
jgi:phosphatidylserine/phosphatidylglycerophosphate/cardiolipin synthase-like enzyme